MGYALKQGNPPAITLIYVGFGTWEFTNASQAVLQYWINVYPAEADADGDGMPDPGSAPMFPPIPVTDTAQRVPILP